MKQPIIYTAISDRGALVRFATHPFSAYAGIVDDIAADYPIVCMIVGDYGRPFMSSLSSVRCRSFKNEVDAIDYLVAGETQGADHE